MAAFGNIPLPQQTDMFQGLIEQYLKQKEMAEKAPLLAAQARRQNKLADLPFGGASLPGPAGQIAGLEAIKQQYGPDSPQYKSAQNAYDLNQRSTTARADYETVLTNTANKRFATPLAKDIQELDDIQQGFFPGTKTPLTDDQKKEYSDRYGLDLLKKTTDQDTRKKNLYSHNMDITIGLIDPNALTQYSGLKGATQLAADTAQSAQGIVVPRYKSYQQSITAAKTLAKQVRQFYGDSITPQIQEGLKELVNPSSWLKAREIALNNYNQFINLLKQESQTYQQAAASPAVYGGDKTNSNQKEPNVKKPRKYNLDTGGFE